MIHSGSPLLKSTGKLIPPSDHKFCGAALACGLAVLLSMFKNVLWTTHFRVTSD